MIDTLAGMRFRNPVRTFCRKVRRAQLMIASRFNVRFGNPDVLLRHLPKTRLARTGHSLIELMVALPLMALVVGGAGSLFFVFSQTRQLSDGLLDAKLDSLQTSQQVLELIQQATSIAEFSPQSFEFLTQDRDGDGATDSIRIAWSGQTGTPMLMSVNGQPETILADNVQNFSLQFETGPAGLIRHVDSAGSVIHHHDNAISGTFDSVSLAPDVVVSQNFLPQLPDDATAWNLHQLKLMARSEGTRVGSFLVSVVEGDDKPNGRILEEAIVSEDQLDVDFGWLSVNFWKLNDLSPDQALNIVVARKSGTSSAGQLQFESGGKNMTPDTHRMVSLDNGSNWSDPDNLTDGRFYVFGTHDGTQRERTLLTHVGLELQIGTDPQSAIRSSVRLVNQPELVLAQ